MTTVQETLSAKDYNNLSEDFRVQITMDEATVNLISTIDTDELGLTYNDHYYVYQVAPAAANAYRDNFDSMGTMSIEQYNHLIVSEWHKKSCEVAKQKMLDTHGKTAFDLFHDQIGDNSDLLEKLIEYDVDIKSFFELLERCSVAQTLKIIVENQLLEWFETVVYEVGNEHQNGMIADLFEAYKERPYLYLDFRGERKSVRKCMIELAMEFRHKEFLAEKNG